MLYIILLTLICGGPAQAASFMRVAHRGAPAHAPENTIPSFLKALELKANYLELDVHQTKDGELVVIHDSTVDRTSNGKGEVTHLRFQEIRQLDAGSWFSPQFKGVKIPTLKEVLLLLDKDKRTQAIIELKHGDEFYPGIEGKVTALVAELNLSERVIIKSFNPAVLARMKVKNPLLSLLYVFVMGFDGIPFTINQTLSLTSPFKARVQILQPHYYFATAAFIQKAHQLGFRVVVWGVDSQEQIKNVIQMGADGIETDYLQILDKLLGPQ
ncbi:MAG TPA: glycerophosphodiester phosphodiesterase family protein [Bacteriovoracaceae bacterium]|nr:glycerophosphodiester phosphodiesterase family protein [Bacteriovoracaceae bacterium]